MVEVMEADAREGGLCSLLWQTLLPSPSLNHLAIPPISLRLRSPFGSPPRQMPGAGAYAVRT
jgi:hypothetical protein